MWPLIAGMAKPITLSHQVRSGGWESMISAHGGWPAHRYTPQVTRRWLRGSEPASVPEQIPHVSPPPLSAPNPYHIHTDQQHRYQTETPRKTQHTHFRMSGAQLAEGHCPITLSPFQFSFSIQLIIDFVVIVLRIICLATDSSWADVVLFWVSASGVSLSWTCN